MILKLKPACKDYLWGGERLRAEYGIQSDLHPLAEAWMLSCHPDGPCVIENGSDNGKTLTDFVSSQGPACLGTDCRERGGFPLLIKLIDAKKDLSIQVHPGDAYARLHEGQSGKTEAWVILDCEPGSFLYCGFRERIGKSEFERRIRSGTLTEVLNRVPVRRGDVVLIPSGTLHAIGRGILLAEIQQSSNVTYRIYDYERPGADGKPRTLHIPQALDVTLREPPAPQPDFGGHLVRCGWFTADLRRNDFEGVCSPASFTSFVVLEGSGSLRCGDEVLPFLNGDSLFLPAGSGDYAVTGSCRVLVTIV